MSMSSRERMLTALSCGEPDYTPLSFMLYTALQRESRDSFDFIERQLAQGLDAVVDLMWFTRSTSDVGHSDAGTLPVRFSPDVEVRQRAEQVEGARYPLLHKEYRTPDGTLTCVVNKTDDWRHGDRVPFMDDLLAPRARKPLITCREDLPALRHLLRPPMAEDIVELRPTWDRARRMAAEKDLLVAAGWGVGADALAWFCGLDNAVLLAIDQPDFMAELLEMIYEWNRARTQLYLDQGLDLFFRRGWYEGTDFWSPALFRRFFFPILKREVEMVHEAGAKFAYILTSGVMPMLDMLLELDIDVLVGVDPVQGKATDMPELRRKTAGRMCLWGGVNGFVTVERGSEEEIRREVDQAMEILAPGGGFILSPVDNVTDSSPRVQQNVLCLIDAWKKLRAKG